MGNPDQQLTILDVKEQTMGWDELLPEPNMDSFLKFEVSAPEAAKVLASRGLSIDKGGNLLIFAPDMTGRRKRAIGGDLHTLVKIEDDGDIHDGTIVYVHSAADCDYAITVLLAETTLEDPTYYIEQYFVTGGRLSTSGKSASVNQYSIEDDTRATHFEDRASVALRYSKDYGWEMYIRKVNLPLLQK